MIYDAADHCFNDFQTGLPQAAAATHIGMYLAWLTLRGLGGPDLDGYLDDLRARRIGCRDFLLDACDGKFTSDDVNDEGAAFTAAYYAARFADDDRDVFSGEFTRTGHALDDLCSIPETWHRFDRLALVLNHRWLTWRAQRDGAVWVPRMTPEQLLARVVQVLQGFLVQERFSPDPDSEARMLDAPSPGRAARLWRTDVPGGRHWLALVLKCVPDTGVTLSMLVASCVDVVAERVRDHGLPDHFRDRPTDPLPYTATLNLGQWLRADPQLPIEADANGSACLAFRRPEDVARLLPVLADRCTTVLSPLLAQLGTVRGLDALRCTSPIDSSILYTDPFNRLMLSTAEVAKNPRILALCDEQDALARDPQAPGMRMHALNALAHINHVRRQHARR